jgi:hypothetical protein
MEVYQVGWTSTCEGVHAFPLEKFIIHTSGRTISTIADFGVEVG